MTRFRGLTWDHPRGRTALEEAAGRWRHHDDPLDLAWETHSLEGFESSPIDELADRYDLIVLDHPHLGDAVKHQSLQPLDDLFGAADRERWAREAIGPTFRSYVYDDQLWALPLDTAAQVAVIAPNVDEPHPTTWDEVESFAINNRVALSLAGPHAFLSFASLCVAVGEEPVTGRDQLVVSRSVGAEAAERLKRIASMCPPGSGELNPIELLSEMAEHQLADYCPLVFGYVNYADTARARRLTFVDAPSVAAGGRPGSTLGGTGIAISRQCDPSSQLIAHLRWLLHPNTQREIIPHFAGQPSMRSAWTDARVNQLSGDFYSNTARTLDSSWIRPRYSGFIGFQSEASARIRSMLAGDIAVHECLDQLDRLYAESHHDVPGGQIA
ncbi:extracellular solute-binding protein [Paramicrobacterium chengjingii]|uniref:extracellular solute-binding protein n=1 Tax=Paramicrobacterium chengjingii TaxID=2769067 RepID=UPI001422502D|nr:extracellular solute-binding protein [Microbacterium chengjingii]